VEKPENIFPNLNAEDAELLYKIIIQMDAHEEGVRVAAMNAATRFFARKGYNWAQVAKAVVHAGQKDQSAPITHQESNSTATASNAGFGGASRTGPTSARPQYQHDWKSEKRQPKKAEVFIPGVHEVHVIDTMYSNGRLRVILRLGERVIRAYVTDPRAAQMLRANKGDTIRAHVRNEGAKWILGEILS